MGALKRQVMCEVAPCLFVNPAIFFSLKSKYVAKENVKCVQKTRFSNHLARKVFRSSQFFRVVSPLLTFSSIFFVVLFAEMFPPPFTSRPPHPLVPDTLSQSQIGGEASSSSRLNYTGETRNSSSGGAAWTGDARTTPMQDAVSWISPRTD